MRTGRAADIAWAACVPACGKLLQRRPISAGIARLVAMIICLLLPLAAFPDPPAIGEPAPAFALQGSDGMTHRLEDYRGRFVVLAWFPKAFTGG